MEGLVQVAGTIEKVESRANRTLWLRVESQENCTDEVIARFATLVGKLGWFCFLPSRRLDITDVAALPDLGDEDGGKSPATRLRAVLWRWWEQKGKPGDFELLYRSEMDKLIDSYKARLT